MKSVSVKTIEMNYMFQNKFMSACNIVAINGKSYLCVGVYRNLGGMQDIGKRVAFPWKCGPKLRPEPQFAGVTGGPTSQKNLKKSLFGGLQQSSKNSPKKNQKTPKRSGNGYF